MSEKYLHLMICDRCGAIQDIPREIVSSFRYINGIECNECKFWNPVPPWLKSVARRERTW